MNLYIIAGVLIGVLIVALIALTVHIQSLNAAIQELTRENNAIAKQVASKQRSVIKGQLAEQLYPMSADCPFIPSDMRFIGSPIDYLIIDGYTDCKDDGGTIKEIILADIKTGNAQLSRHQRAIRDAVNAGKVRFITIQK